MLLARIMLCLTAAVWIGYGGWLFFDPKGLTYAGFELNHWSAVVEVQAMYGAAEFMLGVFTLLGVLYPKRYMHSALLLWLLIYSGLVIGRLVGLAQWGGDYGLVFDNSALPNNYNSGAMWVLELPSAILMGIALWRTRNHPALN